MKKLFFLTALLCASVMGWATQYCETVLTGSNTGNPAGEWTSSNGQNLTFTASRVGNTNKTLFKLTSTTSTITGLYVATLEISGGGSTSNFNVAANTGLGGWTVEDGVLQKEVEWDTYPTSAIQVYLVARRSQAQGGADIMGASIQNIDVSEECPDASDETKPVMTSAEVDSKTHNSVVLAVAATDNIGVTKYHVVDATNAIDANFTPSDGKITINGLTHNTTYNFTITAKDAAGNESENSMVVAVSTPAYYSAPQAAATAPTWPDIQVKALYSPTYNADYTHQDWSSGTVHSKDEFGHKYVTNANGYFGADGFNHNCVGMEKLHYDIWIADNATIRIVPICRNDADSGNEPEVGKTVSLTGQQWNSIDLDLATDYSAVTNWKHVYQVKIDEARNLTFWVGNAYFYTTVDPTADTQKPTDVTATFASADYFSATLTVSATDNSGSISYVVKDGETEVASGSGASGENATIKVNNLTPGTAYTFNVIAQDVAGNEADPVAVNATTIALPAAAPAPTAAAKDVKSLYSDAYDPATTVSDYRQNWWMGADLFTSKFSADDNVLYYIATTDGGAHGWAFDQFDATGFTKLHISIYPLATGIIKIYPVVTGTTEADYYRTSETLVANEWNELTFDFSTVALDKVKQIGWNSYYTLGSFFIDNVYFYKEDATAITNTEVEAKAVKVFENGQLIIIKNGVKYNALGTQL